MKEKNSSRKIFIGTLWNVSHGIFSLQNNASKLCTREKCMNYKTRLTKWTKKQEFIKINPSCQSRKNVLKKQNYFFAGMVTTLLLRDMPVRLDMA